MNGFTFIFEVVRQSRNKILFYPLGVRLKRILQRAKLWFTDLFLKISVNVTVHHLGNIFTGFSTEINKVV